MDHRRVVPLVVDVDESAGNDRFRRLLVSATDADDIVARTALFDGTDAQLAAVYRHMNSAAMREAFAFNGWDGFEDLRLRTFADTDQD